MTDADLWLAPAGIDEGQRRLWGCTDRSGAWVIQPELVSIERVPRWSGGSVLTGKSGRFHRHPRPVLAGALVRRVRRVLGLRPGGGAGGKEMGLHQPEGRGSHSPAVPV